MKKKLSLVQIIFLVISACLPFVDGMFKWTATNLYRGTRFEYDKSLKNLMTVQEVGVGAVVFYIFYIILAITLIAYIVSFFGDYKFTNGKVFLILSALLVALVSIMIFSAAAYYVPLNGVADTTAIMVDIQLLGFIEIGVLVATFVIEIYKQFACKE